MRPLSFIFFVPLLLFSCEDEEAAYPDGGKTGIEMSFDRVMVGSVSQGSDGLPDAVGVYAYNVSAAMPVYDNVKFTVSNNRLKPADDEMQYWLPGENLNVYAYAPYGTPIITSTADTRLDISLQTAQDKDENLKNNDLLFASAYIPFINRQGGSTLGFVHRFSKLEINIKKAGAPDDGSMKDASAIITGTRTTAVFDLEANVLDSAGNNDITPAVLQTPTQGYDKSMEAIVLPQTLNRNARILTITYKGKEYAYNLEDEFTFVSGRAYAFNITLKEREPLILTVQETGWTNHDKSDILGSLTNVGYRVGDYYPVANDPTTAKGVIYEVADDGTSASVVALHEEDAQWGTIPDSEKSSTNLPYYSGEVNLSNLKDRPDFDNFIAIKQGYEYGAKIGDDNVWFLPAANEFAALKKALNDNPVLEEEIITAGGEPLDADLYYTSTCNNGEPVTFSKEGFSNDDQYSVHTIRAICTIGDKI